MIYSLTREEFIAWMERIMDRFDQINSRLERKEKLKNCLDGEVLMDNQDVCLLLKISIRSLQYYRAVNCLFPKSRGKSITSHPTCMNSSANPSKKIPVPPISGHPPRTDLKNRNDCS